MARGGKPAKDPWYVEPGVPKLVRQLVRLRDVGVLALRDRPMRDELDVLIAKADAVHPKARSPYIAVDRLLKTAIAQIAEPTFRNAAVWEFGLGDSASRKPRERREHIYNEIFRISERTFRRSARYERHLIELVASEIEKANSVASEAFFASATLPYVPRTALDGLLETYWTMPDADWKWRAVRQVYVIGEPGTGKSRYVWENCAAVDAAWINASSIDTLTLSIADLLDKHGISTMQANVTKLKQKFGRLLCDDDAPPLVVIDGVDDPTQLDAFIPRITRSHLIITSARKPPDDWAPCIHIPELTVAEAAAMVATLCPDLTAEQTTNLGGSLGGRPLAIVQACAFLNQNADFSVADFCRVLSEDTTIALQSVSERSALTLVSIYRQMLEELRAQNPDTVDLLEFLAFLGHVKVTTRCLSAYLLGNPRNHFGNEVAAKLKITAALRPLIELCLVHANADEISSSALTRAVFRSLFQSRLDAFENRAIPFFSYDRDHLYSELDLMGLGWSATDIASYLLCLTVFVARTAEIEGRVEVFHKSTGRHDPNVRDIYAPGQPPEPPMPDGGVKLDAFLQMQWEALYLYCRFLGTELGELLLTETNSSERRTWDDVFAFMDSMSLGHSYSQGPLSSVIPERIQEILTSEPPDEAALTAWLTEFGLHMGRSEGQLVRWQEIYMLYQLLDAIRSLNPGEQIPDGRELIAGCRRLVDMARRGSAGMQHIREYMESLGME